MLDNIQLINFTNLTINEKKQVLLWRNHHDIKKWMYNQNDITLKQHIDFIKSLKNNKDKLYFVINKNNHYIGVINFDISSSLLGLHINPTITLAKMGNILIKTAIQYSLDSLKMKIIKLEVFHNNIKAINFFKKYKFIKTGSKIIKNKKVICMELKNENR